MTKFEMEAVSLSLGADRVRNHFGRSHVNQVRPCHSPAASDPSGGIMILSTRPGQVEHLVRAARCEAMRLWSGSTIQVAAPAPNPSQYAGCVASYNHQRRLGVKRRRVGHPTDFEGLCLKKVMATPGLGCCFAELVGIRHQIAEGGEMIAEGGASITVALRGLIFDPADSFLQGQSLARDFGFGKWWGRELA